MNNLETKVCSLPPGVCAPFNVVGADRLNDEKVCGHLIITPSKNGNTVDETNIALPPAL